MTPTRVTSACESGWTYGSLWNGNLNPLGAALSIYFSLVSAIAFLILGLE